METFEFTNIELPDLAAPLFRINRAGRNTVLADFQIRRDATYPFCNLHLLVEGSLTVRWQQVERSVAAGSLILLPAGEPHYYAIKPDEAADLLWIEFYGGDAVNQCRQILNRHGPVFGGSGVLAVEALLRLLQDEIVQSAGQAFSLDCQLAVSRLIYEILLALWSDVLQQQPLARLAGDSGLPGQPGQPGRPGRQIPANQAAAVATAINHIQLHPADSPSIEELAGLVRFNTTYFAKLFRRLTGASPARYIAIQKINLARTYLTRDDTKISTIASQLGYCSSSHFIRQFKQLTGVSPSAWRIQSQQYATNNKASQGNVLT